MDRAIPIIRHKCGDWVYSDLEFRMSASQEKRHEIPGTKFLTTKFLN